MADADFASTEDRYSTLAGNILWQLGHLPSKGQNMVTGDYQAEVVRMKGRVIDKTRIFQERAAA